MRAFSSNEWWWTLLRTHMAWLLSGVLLSLASFGSGLALATEEADRLSREARAASKAGDRTGAVELSRQAIGRREARGDAGQGSPAIFGQSQALCKRWVDTRKPCPTPSTC